MIFKNILFHNVHELVEVDGAYRICRLPQAIEPKLNETARRTNHFTTGVELRFVMKSDTVTLKMRHGEGKYAKAVIYFGNIAAGWTCSEAIFNSEGSCFTIEKPDFDKLTEISKACNYEFDPRVVRVILARGVIDFIDVEGEVEPPKPSQMPKDFCLFYGSSITNGSLALSPTSTFVCKIAEDLKIDYRNLGFSGSAQCESEIADYIASQQGMKFIGLAMGANMWEFGPDRFKERIKPFIKRVALSHSDIPIFITDMIYCHSDFKENGSADEFREKVRESIEELSFDNIVYINGLSLLNDPRGLSGDLVHPNTFGIDTIYKNYIDIIKKYI